MTGPATHEIAALRTQLARDLDQLNRHGPEAPGLARRIALARERLEALGLPVEEQPC